MPASVTPVINFHLLKPTIIPARKKLKAFIATIFAGESRSMDTLSIIFCGDDYLLKINKEYLKHDDLTDIITFDLSDQERNSAEIYISIDRVRENASLYGVTVQTETLRVVFHGVLHLCGYADKNTTDIALMRQKEAQYLSTYAALE